MVQYAVVCKEGEWTVFKDAEPVQRALTRSAAMELAKSMAFQAEERGEKVELLIQEYFGEVGRTLSGGDEE